MKYTSNGIYYKLQEQDIMTTFSLAPLQSLNIKTCNTLYCLLEFILTNGFKNIGGVKQGMF